MQAVARSNDGPKKMWAATGEGRVPKKSLGKGMMASAVINEGKNKVWCAMLAFLTLLAEVGALSVPDNRRDQYREFCRNRGLPLPGDKPEDFRADVIFEFGKNAEGYWKNTHVAKQLRNKIIPMAQFLHPQRDHVFVFDNSSVSIAFPLLVLILARITWQRARERSY